MASKITKLYWKQLVILLNVCIGLSRLIESIDSFHCRFWIDWINSRKLLWLDWFDWFPKFVVIELIAIDWLVYNPAYEWQCIGYGRGVDLRILTCKSTKRRKEAMPTHKRLSHLSISTNQSSMKATWHKIDDFPPRTTHRGRLKVSAVVCSDVTKVPDDAVR